MACLGDHAVQPREETGAIIEAAQPIAQSLFPRRRLIRLQTIERGRTNNEQHQKERAGDTERGKDDRPRLMKTDISGQVRAPDEPCQHLPQRIDDIHMVGGRSLAILQLQALDHVVAGEFVHRRLGEMSGKNQIAPLRTDRRQRSRFEPHQRNTGSGDTIPGFDETRDLRGDAGTHGPHPFDHFRKAGGEIGAGHPFRRLAILISHTDLVILVDDNGSIEKIVIGRHVAVIAGHPVEAIRSIDIFGGIVPGGVIVERRTKLFAKSDESSRRRLA